MTFTRDFYIPKNAKPIDCGASDAAIYIYGEPGALFGMAFHGRAQKPDWHFRFKTEEALALKCQWFIARRLNHVRYQAKRRAETNKARALKAGDILSSSWGYDQTNVDFFQVTALVGKTMVEVRPISKESVTETGYMQGKCTAAKDQFTGDATRHRVTDGTRVKIGHRHASLWDGKPKHWSSYH